MLSEDGSFFSAFIAVTSMFYHATLTSTPILRHPTTPFLLEPTKTHTQSFAFWNADGAFLDRQSEEWIPRDHFELAQLA